VNSVYIEKNIEPHQEIFKKGLEMLLGKPEEYYLGFTMVKD